MNSNRVIRKQKTKEELAKERFEEQLRSPNRFVRWGAIARSEKFSKGMTKYMIGAYVIFLIYGLFFTKKTVCERQRTGKIVEETRRRECQ